MHTFVRRYGYQSPSGVQIIRKAGIQEFYFLLS